MKNKKIIIILSLICILVIAVIAVLIKGIADKGKSINIALKQDEILGAVEVKGEANFILLINEKEKVSNIIFLNEKSVELFKDKRIEGKSIEKAVKKIVDIMKNKNSINSDIELIDYENSSIFTTIKNEMNKEFVVYGVDKQILTGNSNFQKKIEELSIKKQKNDSSSIEQLYYYSQELLQKGKK